MVHNSLQVGARQSFRAVPTAYKADDVTVSPLSHNTSSAIGSLVIHIVWYLCHTICTYRDIETFMTIKKQNTSKKGRIVRNGLKPLILLAKVPYFLLTFSCTGDSASQLYLCQYLVSLRSLIPQGVLLGLPSKPHLVQGPGFRFS